MMTMLNLNPNHPPTSTTHPNHPSPPPSTTPHHRRYPEYSVTQVGAQELRKVMRTEDEGDGPLDEDAPVYRQPAA